MYPFRVYVNDCYVYEIGPGMIPAHLLDVNGTPTTKADSLHREHLRKTYKSIYRVELLVNRLGQKAVVGALSVMSPTIRNKKETEEQFIERKQWCIIEKYKGGWYRRSHTYSKLSDAQAAMMVVIELRRSRMQSGYWGFDS